jgi:hypothetical protein
VRLAVSQSRWELRSPDRGSVRGLTAHKLVLRGAGQAARRSGTHPVGLLWNSATRRCLEAPGHHSGRRVCGRKLTWDGDFSVSAKTPHTRLRWR